MLLWESESICNGSLSLVIDLCESSDSEERSSEVVGGQKELVQVAGGTASPFSLLPISRF